MTEKITILAADTTKLSKKDFLSDEEANKLLDELSFYLTEKTKKTQISVIAALGFSTSKGMTINVLQTVQRHHVLPLLNELSKELLKLTTAQEN